MSAEFRVTITELTSTAEKINKAVEEYRSIATKVFESAERLGQCWEGDSQVAFSTEQKTANMWYNRMADLFEALSAALKIAGDMYREADEQATDAVR